VTLTFNHSTSTVSDFSVTATPDGISATPTATLDQASPGIQAANTSTYFTSDILASSVNSNAASGTYYVFTITGLPTDFSFNTVGLDIHALNSGGGYQQNDDNKKRHANYTISVGTSTDGLTDFATYSDLDPAAGIEYDGSKLHRNWNIIAADEAAYTTSTGTLVIKIAISKGTTNEGCFVGFSAITLKTRNYLSQTQNVKYLGSWLDDIYTSKTAEEQAKDDVDEYAILTPNDVFNYMDGKYFTFNRNANNHIKNNNDNYGYGTISTNGDQLYFKLGMDATAIWKLIHTSDNKFKFYNPASDSYIGAIEGHPTDGKWLRAIQNNSISMVTSLEDAHEYCLEQTIFSGANNEMTAAKGQDGFNGYLGIGDADLTEYEKDPSSLTQCPRYWHNNNSEGNTNGIVKLWTNQCGTGNAQSWRFTSWHINPIDDTTAAIIIAKTKAANYTFGSELGQYSLPGDADITSLTNAEITWPTSETETDVFAITATDAQTAAVTAFEGKTLNMPDEQFVSAGNDTYYAADSKLYAFPAGTEATIAEGTEIGKYRIGETDNCDLTATTAVTISPIKNGYGSFIAPVAVTFTGGSAWVAQPLSGGISSAEVNVMSIADATANTTYAAGTGFYTKGDATFAIAAADASADETYASTFKGEYSAYTIPEGKIGFAYTAAAASAEAPAIRRVAEGETENKISLTRYNAGETVPAFTPVVLVDASSEIIDDVLPVSLEAQSQVVTSLSEITAEGPHATNCYDLLGRRVSAPRAGQLIIENGKLRRN
jgi:hypothetical protein